MFVAMLTTDGRSVLVPLCIAEDCTSGYARVYNPYFEGEPEWRLKDGDTIAACDADDPRAQPLADAYANWHRDGDEDAHWMEFAGYAQRDIEDGMSVEDAERHCLIDPYWPCVCDAESVIRPQPVKRLTHRPFASALR